LDDDTTVVEALDPKVMVTLTQNEGLSFATDEAGRRLASALETLTPALTDSLAAPHGTATAERDLPQQLKESPWLS